MNSLVEPEVINALYAASQAGVKIDLIIRGVCCLRPGVKGLSENIKVRSIMGRFLEHTRVIYFYNSGEENIYLSSADWMPRNFFRRVEICFPINDPVLKQRVKTEIFKNYMADNSQSWLLQKDGSYKRQQRSLRSKARSAHQVLLDKFC